MKYWIFIITLIILSSFAYSDGLCELDKSTYNPGESAVFTCLCTTPQERFRDGYIVFRNSSGSVLSSESINSNTCTVSLFGGEYTFPSGSNFSGNATFSLNADGTGFPTNWGGVTDVPYDFFNVTGAGLLECLIEEIRLQEDIIVGSSVAFAAEVLNGVDDSGIVNARCRSDLYDVNRKPIGFVPLGTDYRTTSEGEVGFIGPIDSPAIKINTVYLGEIHCFCPSNSSGETDLCYSESTGKSIGFKSCESTALVYTGSMDVRSNSSDSTGGLSVTLFVLLIPIILFLLAWFKESWVTIKDVYWRNAVNLIIRRGLYVIGIYLMMLNAGILATIARQSNFDLLDELFRYMWLIGWAGYISIMILCLGTLFSFLNILKKRQEQMRVGLDGE